MPHPYACPQVTSLVAANENYGQVLTKAHLWYEGQISGKQPEWSRASIKKGGWRGDSHVKDGQTIGKDLMGGFYDAGGESATRLGAARRHAAPGRPGCGVWRPGHGGWDAGCGWTRVAC